MDNLKESVGKTAESLQKKFLGERGERDQARARGVLAELRRGVGQPVENDPVRFSRVLLTLNPPLDQGLWGRRDIATPSENAAYHALTLFAWHMQSAREPMHVWGFSFASACGNFYHSAKSDSFKPRFDAMLLAGSERSRLQNVRALISLLRGQALGFDYGQFAVDMRALNNPEKRRRTLMRWGRDFARIPADPSDTDS